MVDLLDIAPVVDVVDVDGQPVNVPGVSVEGIVSLLRRFPGLPDMGSKGVTMEAIFAMGPDVVAAVIAAGCGNPGNQTLEQSVKVLNVQAQVDLINGILKRTLPKGLGPFLESVNRLMATFTDPVELAKAKIEQMRASQKPSKPSSDGAVTPLRMSGG